MKSNGFLFQYVCLKQDGFHFCLHCSTDIGNTVDSIPGTCTSIQHEYTATYVTNCGYLLLTPAANRHTLHTYSKQTEHFALLIHVRQAAHGGQSTYMYIETGPCCLLALVWPATAPALAAAYVHRAEVLLDSPV